MATRFIQQATEQVSPIYDTQISQAQSQIPSIQKLYDSLVGGLETQSQRELAQGTQGIVEDASRRGVLRSTLPVDARTELQGAISSALTSGTGNLRLRQLQDVSGVNDRIGQLQINKLSSIQSLADSLFNADEAEKAAARAAAANAAANQQSSAIAALMAAIKARNNQPVAGANLPSLDDIFGASTPQIRVTANTPQTLLQNAGKVNVQPTANARTFQPAGARTVTKQPRLQGAGATSGSLRVR